MERLKQKGDYFLGDRKYRRAIGMYNQILGMRKNQELTGDFYGNVWNNKGLAYAALYLFDEAFSCMKKAHEELPERGVGTGAAGGTLLDGPPGGVYEAGGLRGLFGGRDLLVSRGGGSHCAGEKKPARGRTETGV